jgi:hypothetical protein
MYIIYLSCPVHLLVVMKITWCSFCVVKATDRKLCDKEVVNRR